MDVQEVCFSPPGPGQCQPWHDVKPHSVDEPSIFVLLALAGVVAWITRRRK